MDPPWATVVDFLAEVTGDAEGVERRLSAGEILLADGTPVRRDTTYVPGTSAYLYRDLPDEVPVPGELAVLLRDDASGLLAVDKPPFLATMPRGGHVAQTVVTRLRRDLDLPDLAPVHRLDRLTSGVLLLTTRRAARRPYQSMVQQGGLTKVYEALAAARGRVGERCTVVDRIEKERGSLQVRVVPGEVNAETTLELVEVLGDGLGRYRLHPRTGRTHQLRVHLAGRGTPIAGDPLYPEVRQVAPDDFSTPLQLLAREVSFTDPVTGQPRRILSRRSLPLTGPGTLR